MFTLVKYLTGKAFDRNEELDQLTKRIDKVNALKDQYNGMIRSLKGNGAYLNTIRPEYLLSFNDYKLWIRSHPPDICTLHTA